MKYVSESVLADISTAIIRAIGVDFITAEDIAYVQDEVLYLMGHVAGERYEVEPARGHT